MHRAVLTPKRLISNLFAISPYIVKVIPLAEIAVDSLLPVDFGHGQFTRVDRDFIPQKTIPSRQLWEQTAKRKYRPPPPRGSSAGPSQGGDAGGGDPSPSPHPSPPPSHPPRHPRRSRGSHPLQSTGHGRGGGWRGAEERGCSPLPGHPRPAVRAPPSPSFPCRSCKPPATPPRRPGMPIPRAVHSAPVPSRQVAGW